MSRRRVLLLVALAAIGLRLSYEPAQGYSFYNYGGSVVVWYGAGAARYLSPSTFAPGSDTDLLYRGAMGLWMMVPSADFQYVYDYYEPEVIDNFDGYSDTVAVDPSMLDPGVLGVTFLVNNGPEWYDMDMLFSANGAGLGWNFETNPSCEVIADPATNGVSFVMVAAHELGHALGLGHDPFGDEPAGYSWFIGTMNPYYPDGGPIGDQSIVELHGDDRNGLRFLYPHSGTAQTLIDLANSGYSTAGPIVGKCVPAPFTPAALLPGETLTVTSTIENFGNVHVFNVAQGFYLSSDPNIDSSDIFLGELFWDLPMGDGYEFSADVDLPDDLPAGPWYTGSILDDGNAVAEEYEDNNVHVHCAPVTVLQLAPVILDLPQEIASCGTAYTGPTPAVTHPLNMAPLTWSLDNPEPGMWIESVTGIVHWDDPQRSPFPYTLILRATNDAGTATKLLFLGVDQGVPALVPIAPQSTPHTQPYTGPTPELTDHPCMRPILNWSLDAGPPGMEIDHSTGVVTWDRPRFAHQPYTVSIRATNATGNGIVTWQLSVTGKLGDLDCNGVVDFFDIDPFLRALSGETAYWQHYPDCEPRLADCDGDGQVTFMDIDGFLELLGS